MADKLKQCTIVLTRGCNLRCDFCYVKDAGYDVMDKIPYDDLLRIVNFCCDANMKYIFFTGGEPLTYPYLIDILRYIKQKKPSIITAVASNGILLENLEYCTQLIDSGIGYMDISMKGSDSISWEKATGYDGMAKQLQAIRNLASSPIEFTCSMVITPENVMSFCDAVQEACNNGARQFSFTFVIDNIDAEEKNQYYLEENNPFALIDAFISQMDRLNNIIDDWWIEYSFPICVYTEKQLQLLEGRLATPCQIHMKNAVTFNTKLELLPCDMYINQKIGKLGRDFSSYEEYERLIEQPEYQSIMKRIRKLPSTKCVSCKHLDICYGGCPVLWKNYSFDALMKFKDKFVASD